MIWLGDLNFRIICKSSQECIKDVFEAYNQNNIERQTELTNNDQVIFTSCILTKKIR